MGVVEAVIGSALIGAASSGFAGHKQRKAAKNAANQAQDAARRQERAAEQAQNRANQKRANPGAALAASQQAGKSGASGTLLTGQGGIDPNALTLGKNTLLGA